MAGKEEEKSAQEQEEVGKLSAELKVKLSLEEQEELANKEKAKHQRMLEEEIEYYKNFILTKVESLLIPEDHASFYAGGVDEIRRRNEGIRKQHKMTKDLAFNLLRNLLKKHGIKRGYVNNKEAGVPLSFLKFLAEHHLNMK